MIRSSAALAALALAACEVEPPVERVVSRPASTSAASTVGPGTIAVRIGESGPAFDACAIRAVVTDAGGASVPVRAAPFPEGAETATIESGTRLYVCTRSLDQRWLGIVVNPAPEGGDRCGLQARVERPRSYVGPCVSGWVPRAAVRLTAG